MLHRASNLRCALPTAVVLARSKAVHLAAASLAAVMLASVAQAAPIVTFSWSPLGALVNPGATEIFVELLADQSDGADAAFLTLGFEPSGAITGVELVGFGAPVSTSDSFFTDIAGAPALLGSAPASPGSFGADVDFVIATLRVLINPNAALGASGALTLVDLSAVAGAPALQSDGVTPIDADLSESFSMRIVPEPGVLSLVALGLAGLSLSARRRN